MRLYEAEGKRLLADAGFAVPRSRVVADGNEATNAASELGFPCVLKAQTLSGRRFKRGLVAIVDDECELRERLDAIRDAEPIAGWLIEERIEAAAEYYLSLSIAEAEGYGVLMISASGGVDIESYAGSMVRIPLDGRSAPVATQILDALQRNGIATDDIAVVAAAAERLAVLALENECTVAEINPLFVRHDGSIVVGDAKIEIDDDARKAAPNVTIFDRHNDPLEEMAAEQEISLVRLDGDIGTIVGGAGLAMLTVDALGDAGLRPANFIDLQGSSTKKFIAGFDLVRRIGGIRAILTNNAGGLNPCLSLAEGIVEGAKRMDASIPIVVKLHGADERAAWQYLERHARNVHVCKGTTGDAVRQLQSLL